MTTHEVCADDYSRQIAHYQANVKMSGFKGLPERVALEEEVAGLKARVTALEVELADLHLFSKEE